MTITTVIFDLDGTLVDSAPGILQAMGLALEAHKLAPAVPLTPALIGPPLQQTLQTLCPLADAPTLDALTEAFKQQYDCEAYLQTIPFAGVDDMLARLAAAGLALFIATNKRHIPTQKIMDALGWRSFFEQVYSPDSIEPRAASKGALLVRLLERHGLDRGSVLYVGDRLDDERAALQAGVHFFHATWGYEGSSACTAGDTHTQLAALLAYLAPHQPGPSP